MPKTRFQFATEFLDTVKKLKGDLVEWGEFKIMIERKLGSDKYRTVKPYLKLMTEQKLIKSEGENVRIL